jgi:tryptophanyl-tRNA synthetase
MGLSAMRRPGFHFLFVFNWHNSKELTIFQNKDVLSRLYCIVDLHAITVRSNSSLPSLQQRSFQCAAFLLACGLDSSRCTLFVQSHVPQHASLCWLLQCCTPLSWLHQMTQFKSKSHSSSQGSAAANTALLTYPVLQAADILLYDFTL